MATSRKGADMYRLGAYRYRPATLALLFAAVVPAFSHAADGTIRFSGMIVAPPYEIHAIPAALPSRPGAQGGNADIEFLSQPTNRPSASVRVDGLGNQPLTVRHTDARGHVTKMASASTYHLGRQGGTLSVASSGNAPGSTMGAIVTVTYD